MASPRTDLNEDVEELLQQSVVAEAQWKALAQLDVAISSLDPADRQMLEAHFNGRTHAELGAQHGISEAEARECLDRIKRGLIQSLKAGILVRQ